MRKFTFNTDGSTEERTVNLGEEQGRRLGEVLLLFYTGITRQADSILSEQRENIVDQEDTLLAMRAQVEEMEHSLQAGSFHKAARILDAGWEMKKALANKISSSAINDLYERALDAGATGGKIAGAGGGGFLLVFCPPDRQSSVRLALSELKELPFQLERDGSKVIFNNRRT
jgi:D-glycero-alpha-D-manno-heptose-7-phosphate kinase